MYANTLTPIYFYGHVPDLCFVFVPGLCKDEASQKVLGGGVLQKLKQLLVNKNVSESLVAKTIAEIAKIGKIIHVI